MLCTKCKQDKPAGAFGKHRRQCRACVAKYDKERYLNRTTEQRERDKKRWRDYAKTPKGKCAKTETVRRDRRRHPERARARNALNRAIRDGKVTTTGVCEHCGTTEDVHCHHDDYSKPLTFRELCAATCHPAADKACGFRCTPSAGHAKTKECE